MTRKLHISCILLLTVLVGVLTFQGSKRHQDQFLDYRVDAKHQSIKFYWKDEKGQPFKSLHNLKERLAANGQNLLFATNGGMYKAGNSPVGLYIEAGRLINPLDTNRGSGNFYLKPNGVFYITTENKPNICTSEIFRNDGKIKYATQSGPMLVIDGAIHLAFKKNSANLNIRNGVGILPDGKIMFVMSKKEINFYDFALYFQRAGCKNALYLDGFVSRTYLPARNWIQTDGDFGVIIGEIGK